MLGKLFIQNYALIERVEIDFSENLNIITGETGAGKSILLGGIGLIAGKRADTSVLFDKEKKCVVEAHFNIKTYGLKSWFLENELDYDEHQTIIRREISNTGNSRAFINDTPVSLNILKELSAQIIDIHSQHENLLLNSSYFQIQIVDSYCKNESILNTYQKLFGIYLQNKKELAELNTNLSIEDQDFYAFQIQELETLAYQQGEFEQLESELNLLLNAETIKQHISFLIEGVESDEVGVLSILGKINHKISSIKDFIPSELFTRLQGLRIDLEDISAEFQRISSSVEYEAGRILEIQERLDKINQLVFKHRVDHADQLATVLEHLQNKLDAIESAQSKLTELTELIAARRLELIEMAGLLRKNRCAVIPSIEDTIQRYLSNLNMKDAEIVIEHTPTEELNNLGMDSLVFLIKTNKGTDFKPISKTASGGEISRIMLAIKYLISEKIAMPTLILDEIDTGVSGITADLMAKTIFELSKNTQTIIISHLAQVASLPAKHFNVRKDSDMQKTITTVSVLSAEDRVQEIAKMLGGIHVSKTTLEAAGELLNSKR